MWYVFIVGQASIRRRLRVIRAGPLNPQLSTEGTSCAGRYSGR